MTTAMPTDSRHREPFDPERVLTGRASGQTRLHFAAKQIVFRQGASPHALFYIEHGVIKISALSPCGREAVTGLRGAGDFIGVRSLLRGSRFVGTAAALTDCAVISIGKSATTRMLREEAEFAEMFINYLIRQHIRDQASLIDQLTNSAERRLARVLLQLSSPGGRPVRIDQETLANMIGTTRPRVSSFMNKFRKCGFIEYDRGCFISVRSGLRRLLRDA
jgi:CRP/FNR family cyclic AMP-dependent transcriptional regulator